MRIIELGPEHAAEAHELKRAVFNRAFDTPPLPEKSVRRALRRGTRKAFGIREKGRLLSVIYLNRRNAHTWFVPSVATLPEARGRGMAEALLQKGIQMARTSGATSMGAVVSPQNKASLSLLEKHGFTRKRFLPNHFGQGKHRWQMQLKLKP